MPPRPNPSRHTTAQDTTAAVDAFMRTLTHPRAALIATIRTTVLGAHRSIAEGIKWKAPSFRTHEYFATVNLREPRGVGVILHLGAKARALPSGGLPVPDPRGLLTWLGRDRAMVVFTDEKDFAGKRAAFVTLIRKWIAHV